MNMKPIPMPQKIDIKEAIKKDVEALKKKMELCAVCGDMHEIIPFGLLGFKNIMCCPKVPENTLINIGEIKALAKV